MYTYTYIYNIYIYIYIYIISSNYLLHLIVFIYFYVVFDEEKQSNICNCLTDCRKNQKPNLLQL